jgi:hypothetical protein
VSQLALGQLIAALAGLFLFFAEWVRLRDARLSGLEGCRLWGFLGFGQATFFAASHADDAFVQACLVTIGTIGAALILNNLYLLGYKRLHRDLSVTLQTDRAPE